MKKTRFTALILCIMLIAASAAILWSCGDDENTLGRGSMSFKLEIIDNNGSTKTYTVKTNEKTVGDALMKVGILIEDGYIETVDGIKADWDVDEGWWGFYANGEFSMIGVFDLEPEKDAAYLFKYEKGMGEMDWGDWDDDGE